MESRTKGSLWLGASVVLMLVFVNSVAIWAYLYRVVASKYLVLLPFVITAVVIIALVLKRSSLRQPREIAWLVAAVVVAAIGLSLPDAQVLAKRIHIPEYMILALVVRKACSFHLNGHALLVWSAIIGVVLGVHDELLQGLHTQRYFGTRDMMVNAFGAASGAMLGHGLGLFENQPRMGVSEVGNRSIAVGVLVFFVAIFVLVIGIEANLGGAVAGWTILPIVAAAVVWIVTVQAQNVGQLRWVIGSFFGFATATAAVPFISWLLELTIQ